MAKASSLGSALGVSPALGTIDGVTIAGGVIGQAQYEYEVCFKCHADNTANTSHVAKRLIVQTNKRLQMGVNAISYHPVALQGKNVNVPSLRPPYTTSSLILCTDCHGSSDSKKAGGSGPNGLHGSAFPALLLARYDTADLTPYTTTAYALCFTCHDNTKVVADSGPFPRHKTHIQDQSTPCSICHDSHGISAGQGTALHNFALINFDSSVVLPDTVTKKLEFDHTAPQHGQCFLNCHGVNHSGTSY
jgi:hypothetical protein